MPRIPFTLHPGPAEVFKRELLARNPKRAIVRQWRADGSFFDATWKADNFDETSGLQGNIRTGYARPRRCARRGVVRVAYALDAADLPD